MKSKRLFAVLVASRIPSLAFPWVSSPVHHNKLRARNKKFLRLFVLSSQHHQQQLQQQLGSPFLEDRLQTASENVHEDASRLIVEAAAAVTKESNKLLGIKSIGVDYGLVRTGIAVTVGYNPKPLDILSVSNATQVATEIVNYCVSERASQVVVGLPLHKNGTEAEQSNITRTFAVELARQCLRRLGPHFRIYLWDERYTSKEAAARAHSADPYRFLYGTLDAEAACIILETYYSDNGISAEQVILPVSVQQECLAAWETQQQEMMRFRGSIQSVRRGRDEQKLESMERARKLEEELQKSGILGGKPKKAKRKREKRGAWVVPLQGESGLKSSDVSD